MVIARPSTRINDKIKALAPDAPFFSFEFFPPVTRLGLENLHERVDRLSKYDPLFVAVTWGSGGSTAEKSLDLAVSLQVEHQLTTCLHITCTNMDRRILDQTLLRAKEAGIRNVMALRGDPPRGQEYWTATSDDFKYAIDLVKYIRKTHGDWFCIGVAAYPEGHADESHPEALDIARDVRFLAEKVRAGADFILTQMFYDVDAFTQFVETLKQHDPELFERIPIIPAIMPIQSYQTFMRMTGLTHAQVPAALQQQLEAVRNDDAAVKQVGVDHATRMINEVRRSTGGRVRGSHFCTLNLERSVALILRNSCLRVTPSRETSPPTTRMRRRSSIALNGKGPKGIMQILQQSHSDAAEDGSINSQTVSEGRGQEGRDATWDEFPNGRFGDSRSPAYGEIDGWGVTLNMAPAKARQAWGTPERAEDVTRIFVDHISGHIAGTPWSGGALSPETGVIRDQLLALNRRGLWTIGSQPAVNCAESVDPIFGWGPPNGYIYQKSFVELFVDHRDWPALEALMRAEKQVSFYAANKDGEFVTNMTSGQVNAVTWGIFPGKDIAQPTIIEEESFKAWKNEAFALWEEWARLYPIASPPARLLRSLADQRWLVTIVHHGFKDEQALWQLLESATVTSPGA
ncbi:methylenetetrahydrofolate reductase 1 [Savitreella phatthalungensis]